MFSYKSKKAILLTGAGFTKNFGGFLGKQMWEKIFNNPLTQASQRVRDLLENDENFESVYTNITMKPGFSSDDIHTIKEATKNAYRELDEAIRLAHPWSGGGGRIFAALSGTASEKGFFFTLNQDLFMERVHNFRCPGATKFPEEFNLLPQQAFKENFFVQLPLEDTEELIKKGIENHIGLHYIKLHGSYGWRSSDESDQMVLGGQKEEDIGKEPLLKYYFDLFKEVIHEGDKKLLIIGYGFRDKHINKVLIDGIDNYGLRLQVIAPKTLPELKREIPYYAARDLSPGIERYWPYTLEEIERSPEVVKDIVAALTA